MGGFDTRTPVNVFLVNLLPGKHAISSIFTRNSFFFRHEVMADFEKMNVSDFTKEVVRTDVSTIIIDTKILHGQIRPLKDLYVHALMTRLQQQSPTVIFGCLARQHEGTMSTQCSHRPDGTVYCLG